MPEQVNANAEAQSSGSLMDKAKAALTTFRQKLNSPGVISVPAPVANGAASSSGSAAQGAGDSNAPVSGTGVEGAAKGSTAQSLTESITGNPALAETDSIPFAELEAHQKFLSKNAPKCITNPRVLQRLRGATTDEERAARIKDYVSDFQQLMDQFGWKMPNITSGPEQEGGQVIDPSSPSAKETEVRNRGLTAARALNPRRVFN